MSDPSSDPQPPLFGPDPGRARPAPARPRPLSTRECAECLGVRTGYIRDAIRDGDLVAEAIRRPFRRTLYRVHEDDFVAFLLKVKWSRIPDRFAAIVTRLRAPASAPDEP